MADTTAVARLRGILAATFTGVQIDQLLGEVFAEHDAAPPLGDVRRYCELTLDSCRVQAREVAQDVLDLLDGKLGRITDADQPIPYTLAEESAPAICHDVQVDGLPVRYRGRGELTPAAADALGALVTVARRQLADDTRRCTHELPTTMCDHCKGNHHG